MYVIYINDRRLTLLSKEELRTCDPALLYKDIETHLTANYSGKPRTLLHYVDMLEKGSPRVLSVAITAADLEQLWNDFRSKYKWIPAAGGVVRNVESGKTLFIFRRGSWDLPKGKIDEGEDAPIAALREVEEETGVSDLTLGETLPTTYHTYFNRKGKRVLKPTYWFRMSTCQIRLVPETEEDIEQAEWLDEQDVLGGTAPLYASLRNMLEQPVER